MKTLWSCGMLDVSPLIEAKGFAITRNSDKYTINHVKSGIAITSALEMETAMEGLEFLSNMVTPTGVRLADVPGCELCAMVSWIQKQYALNVHGGKYAANILKSDSVKRAAEIADALQCQSISQE